jgi:hypothetical protein
MPRTLNAFLFSLLIVIGCASTGVVQTDANTYMIAKKNPQVGFGPPIGVRAEVYQEANEFCAKQNEVVETIKLELTNAGFARSAAATLVFRCKAKE